MTNPLDTANLRVRLNKIMQVHQLKPEEVKKERSNIAVSDRGEFTCAGRCGANGACYKWQSNYSWVTFDLIRLEVVYRWKMKCMYCLEDSIPTFTVEQLETMFDKAVSCYKGDFNSRPIDIGNRERRFTRYPHRPELCEKCCWGRDQCWLRKFTYFQ